MAGLIPVRFDIIIVGSLFTFRGFEEVIDDGEEKAQEEAFNLWGFPFFRVSIDCSGARSDNNLLHVRVNLGKIWSI